MKKVLFLIVAIATAAFAGEGEMLQAYSVLAASVGLGLAALGGAVGMGNTAAATIAGTARNPGRKTNDNNVYRFSDDRSTSYLCTCYIFDCSLLKPIYVI